jgi:hypothetical protein
VRALPTVAPTTHTGRNTFNARVFAVFGRGLWAYSTSLQAANSVEQVESRMGAGTDF